MTHLFTSEKSQLDSEIFQLDPEEFLLRFQEISTRFFKKGQNRVRAGFPIRATAA